ncbi:MAG: hypothetical protein ACREGJ_02080 [Candidatus Saccharimonadales bacterium]
MDFLKLLQQHFRCGQWVDVSRLILRGEFAEFEVKINEKSEELRSAWNKLKPSLLG